LCERARQAFIFHGHVVELAVRFDVAQARALGGGYAGERANLNDHHVVGFLVCDRHIAAAQALQVG
jgi:hypothetical protein